MVAVRVEQVARREPLDVGRDALGVEVGLGAGAGQHGHDLAQDPHVDRVADRGRHLGDGLGAAQGVEPRLQQLDQRAGHGLGAGPGGPDPSTPATTPPARSASTEDTRAGT